MSTSAATGEIDISRVRKRNNRDRLITWAMYTVLVALSILMLLPFFWMLTTSFKPPEDVFSAPPVIVSENATLQAYRDIFDDGLLRVVFNTLVYATGATLLRLLVSAMAGYGFAKFRFRGRNGLFAFVIGTMVIPFTVLMVPTFIILRSFGLLDTQWGLILPGAASAFGVFFMRQYIMAVPDDLIDSARVDGASEWRIFRSIILPVVRPGLIALGLIFFMASWNDYVWPLIVVRSPENFTLPLAIRSMIAGVVGRPIYQNQMAASVISVLPLLVLFLAFQRRIVEGISGGAVKG